MVNLSNLERVSLSAYEREVLNLLRGINPFDSENSLYQQVASAPDLVRTYEYTDVSTDDERVISATWSSAELDTAFVDTYTYDGQPGRYRLTSIVRSRGNA